MTLTEEQSPEAAWKQCLKIIKEKVNGQSYKTWFEPITAASLETGMDGPTLTVQLPSRFYYEWLEEHYRGLLHKTVSDVLGPRSEIFYAFDSSGEDDEYWEPAYDRRASGDGALLESGDGAMLDVEPAVKQSRATSQVADEGDCLDSQLNPSYVFDSYIEGDCNRLARSAALAIAAQPGSTSFNPLLVYGGVGLGKTHLIQAIGNYVKHHKKANSVLYVSSERFTSDFVHSIQHNRIGEFSQFYRSIDLLIVDDIQFFGGKEKTQEEFFHVFNALHQSGKQIILSADRPPKNIQGIEERLLSRFQWGLSADVQPPDLETRIAIVQRKAEEMEIDIPHEVVEFITNNIDSNIRELEGALIRLLAHATLRHREIDLSLARESLRDMIKERSFNRTIEDIQEVVADYFKIPVDMLRAKTRKREIVQARQAAMYMCKHFTTHSLKKIGLHFGGRDHSTVIHAIDAVENQMETDPNFRASIEAIHRKMEAQYF